MTILLSRQPVFMLAMTMLLLTATSANAEKDYNKLRNNQERRVKSTKKQSHKNSDKTQNRLTVPGGTTITGGWYGIEGQDRTDTVGGNVVQNNPVINVASSLIEPKPCIPWAQASQFFSDIYPSDPECRVESGQMKGTGDCCRLYDFTDPRGAQGWLYYDGDNSFSYLGCVCNENTAAVDRTDSGSGTQDGGVIEVSDSGSDGGTQDGAVIEVSDSDAGSVTSDSGSGTDSGSAGGPTPTEATVAPTEATVAPTETPVESPASDGICAPDNLTSVQKSLQGYMSGCQNSSECASNKCCYAQYCVCWPIEKLASGLAGGTCI